MRKYQLAATLAAQDWLTCLAWERPELLHRLPATAFTMMVVNRVEVTGELSDIYLNWKDDIPGRKCLQLALEHIMEIIFISLMINMYIFMFNCFSLEKINTTNKCFFHW